MKSKWLISVGLVVCLVMVFTLPMCAPAPPVEEEAPPVEEEQLAKSIKAYMGMSPDNNVAVVNFIDEKLGVLVMQHFMSFGEIGAKLEAEAPRFSADMVIGAGFPQAYRAKEGEWLLPYDSPAWRGASGGFKDPDNYSFNIGGHSFALVGNKPLLDEAGYTMPESWDDLLDPKWEGNIIAPSPTTSGTAFQLLYTFITIYGFNKDKGEEGGWEYIEKLDKNIHHYGRSGNTGLETACRGEFMLGLCSDEDILGRQEEGYPLVYSLPVEGFGYDRTMAFILKGTEEEYTCQKIVDVLGTKDFAKMFAGLGTYVTKFPDVPTALYPAGKAPKFLEIDMGWFCENKSRLVDEWKARFIVKYKE